MVTQLIHHSRLTDLVGFGGCRTTLQPPCSPCSSKCKDLRNPVERRIPCHISGQCNKTNPSALEVWLKHPWALPGTASGSKFYVGTTIALLQLVRRSLRIASGKTSLLARTGIIGKKQSDAPRFSSDAGISSDGLNLITVDRTSMAATRLRKSYSEFSFRSLASFIVYDNRRT